MIAAIVAANTAALAITGHRGRSARSIAASNAATEAKRSPGRSAVARRSTLATRPRIGASPNNVWRVVIAKAY